MSKRVIDMDVENIPSVLKNIPTIEEVFQAMHKAANKGSCRSHRRTKPKPLKVLWDKIPQEFKYVYMMLGGMRGASIKKPKYCIDGIDVAPDWWTQGITANLTNQVQNVPHDLESKHSLTERPATPAQEKK